MKPPTITLISILAALGAAPVLHGQEIHPVWVEHLNGLINVAPADKLPTLVRAGGTGDNTYGFAGRDVIDSYVDFIKYDDAHYMLGIRENGINEDDPNLTQAQKDIAAAYPDRSIIWIDAATGKPMGVALKTEINPVPVAAQSALYAWWKYGVTDGANGERVVYTGYRYKILRYAASGTTPTRTGPMAAPPGPQPRQRRGSNPCPASRPGTKAAAAMAAIRGAGRRFASVARARTRLSGRAAAPGVQACSPSNLSPTTAA